MKKLLVAVVSAIAMLGVAAFATLYLAPGFVVSTTQSVSASLAGLEKKTVEIDGYEVSYYDGGQGDAVVLLHGMADEKNSFVPAISELTENHRIILPDLNGHGENERDPKRDYSIAGHVAFLEAFFAKLGVDEFALGGNSMGGHVSAAYAVKNPEQVRKLILVNAPGLKLDDHVVYGGFGAKMESREDFAAMMQRVVHNPPSLPGPIVDHLVDQTNQNFDFINNLAVAVKQGADFDLKDRISEISVPTLILWGMEDEVVKLNVAEAYNALIPNSELVKIEDAGHSPQLEIPERIGREISQFLSR